VNSTTEAETETDTADVGGIRKIQVIDYGSSASVENISKSLTSTNDVETQAIGPVADLTKTFINATGTNSAIGTFNEDLWRLRVDSVSQIAFNRHCFASETLTWEIDVIEFTDGTTTDSGLHTLANTDATDDITISVTSANSAPASLGGSGNWNGSFARGSQANDDIRNVACTAVLVSDTILRITRTQTTGDSFYFYWVIDWTDAGAAAPLTLGGSSSPIFRVHRRGHGVG